MATQSLRVEEPRARVATFENDRKRTLSPPSSAYVIRVVANGETYGVPVTYNTRVASIIREVAELAISQEDSRVLGEVQATLYYRHQPLMPDAPIGSVPPESTLYFHVNQSYVEAAPVVPPAGRCATPSRLAAGKRGYLPQTSTTTAHGYPPNTSVTLRPVHNQGHQKMVDFSEPRSMSTSNSPPGVSEGSSEPQRSLPSGTNGDYAAMYQPAAGTNPVPVRGGYLPLSQVHPSPMYMAPPHHAVSEQSMHSSGKLGTRVPSTALPGNPWGLVDRGMTYRVPIKSSDDMPYGAPGAQATGYAQPYRGPYYAPPAASYPTTLHPVVPGEEQAYRQSHGSAKIHLSGMEDGRPVSRDTPDSAADAALPTSRPVAHVAEPVVAKEEPRVVVMESEVETHRRLSSPSPIPPQRSAAAPPVPPPPPAPPATIMVEPPENAELQSQVDLLQRSDQEHLLIYIELPEDKEMSNSVATTSHIGTANDQILALFPSMRRLRVRRNFPIATLRELYSVDRKWRIFMASTLIKDEHLTIGELNVAPNTIFRFGLPDASVMASKRRSSMISKQLMQSWTTNANSAMEEERSPVSRASTNSFIGNTAAPRLRSTSTQEAAPRTPPTDRQSHYSRDGQVLSEASRKKSVPSSSRLKHIQSKEETMEVRRRSSRMDDPMMQSWGERSTTAEPPARRESPPRNTRDGRTHAAEYQESHRQETFITPGQLKPRTTEQQRAEVVPVSATSQRLAPLAEERDSGRTRSSPPSTTLRRREAPDSDRTIDVNELSSSSSGPVGDAVSRATRSRQAYHQPRPSARRQATTVTTTTVRTSTRRQRHKHNLAPAVATVGPLDDNYVGSQITPSTLIPAGTAHDDGSARSTTMRYTYKRQEESLHNSPSSKPAVDDQQLLVTIVDPTDPTVFHHDVPVDRCFPVGILRELLAEELSSSGAGGQPALPSTTPACTASTAEVGKSLTTPKSPLRRLHAGPTTASSP